MKARVIAYYLPQFHPVKENDRFWGKGFTEWTNVAKAKPLFRGHYQPRIPADLGFYDLRLPEVREQQAELAREAGIEGFCYWHYWFGNGKMLLQRPFEEVLSSGKPDFPFCLCWANHSWSTKTWDKDSSKTKNSIIAEQLYPGDEDYIAHFNYCLPAFKDHRYITIEGKPVFGIYEPFFLPDAKHFMNIWRELAIENGLKGIYFYAITRSANFNRFNEEGKIIRLNLKEFNKKSILFRKRLLIYTIEKLLGNSQNIEKVNVDDVIGMCEKNIGNKYLKPNKNIKISVNKGKIFFEALD